ncbi:MULTISPECIES: allophanate hydrolase subunit 1 [unclassified Lentimonas]|uniref:5-oxoprolinase subunit B family protein n=1 Tax=unclassified Lentimonas TaxID=2630993 RepID=UPI00132C25DA|nr:MULTISPECIES: carboxyltransferase domain-containing protein [unclassified Lentimonas]CAA6696418.1 Allophanate hydrolase 2 subunit 1 (EC [Lentimonas sp. CC10]CAA6697670.1 Allophanate hydrolase 2 subunit 1 (EC [Lentimonas sp. CC19]CAA7071491.1 Allophanate hydrolase 2 subunit 1 (EC [Lentimonas sp. CC11]
MVTQIEESPFKQTRIRPYGERGFLLDGFGGGERGCIEQALRCDPPEALEDCVWGADNCLVVFVRPVEAPILRVWLEGLQGAPASMAEAARRIEVPVIYDGADLKAVAQQVGLTESEVVAIHSAPEYRVRMMGFTPGFPYLDGLDKRLHIERKASPRNRIEPGAVAIGGCHAGIYSVASPCGWHLLGRTELPLFRPEKAMVTDCDARDIFTLAAGDTVKFIPS